MAQIIQLAQEVEEEADLVVETTEACIDLGPLCNLWLIGRATKPWPRRSRGCWALQ